MKKHTILALALLAGCASPQRPAPPTPALEAGAADASNPIVEAGPVDAAPAASPAAARLPLPAVEARPVVTLPPVVHHTLANGLESALVELHSLPVLHLRLVVREAGTAADGAQQHGLAALTGDLLQEGTARRDARAVHDAVDDLGTALTVSTSRDTTVLSLAVLREHAERALSLLAEVVGEPAFLPAELERVRRRELDRLSLEAQDPDWLGREAFARELYGDEPYNHNDATEASLRRLGRADLARFHREHYVAGSMVLVAVGDVQPAQWRALVERTMARLRRGTAPASTHVASAHAAGTARRIVLVDRPGSEQSVVRVGNRALARASDEYVPLTVVNQVLGGGAQSRLFVDLREHRSLTYGAYSGLGAFAHGGHFLAQASVRTAVTAEAVGAFLENLERLTREEPSAQELSEARDYLVDSFALSVDSGTGLASVLSELRSFGLPDDWWARERAQVAAVQGPQVLTLAQRYVHPAEALIVVVGDAQAIEAGLRRFGAVRVVDAQGRPRRARPAR